MMEPVSFRRFAISHEPQTFTTNVEHHVVAEFAPAINYQALYLDGVLQQISTTPAVGAGTNLSRLHDPNVWLGVSQQWNEPPLNGRLNELRIYDGVLNDADIALSREAGPDALPVPRPALSFSVSGSNLILSWPTNSGNVALMSSPTLGTNATWNPAGSPTVVGQNYQVTVPITNTSFYFRLQQ